MSSQTTGQKYDDLFFDIDNTIVDFEKGSKQAFANVINEIGITFTDEVYNQFTHVNRRYWIAFEKGEIDNATLRSERFEAFFREHGYGDYNGGKINDAYLKHLILTTEALPGIKGLLKSLKADYRIHAITNGFKEVQRPRLKRMDLIHLFDSITVSDEIGIAKPDVAYFDHAFNQNSPLPIKKRTLVIGDSLTSDIQGGNLYGVDTCWISNTTYNEGKHKPTYTLQSTLDIRQVL